MPPALSVHNRTYSRSAHTESLSDDSLNKASRAQFSYFQNLLLGKLGSMVLLSSLDSNVAKISTLCVSVLHIVTLCTEKQMGWSNTRRVITNMAHVHALWDLAAKCKLHSKPMGSVELPSCSDASIATAHSGARPFQASIPLWHRFGQKLLKKLKVVKLVMHNGALLCSMCWARAMFTHRRAFYYCNSGRA